MQGSIQDLIDAPDVIDYTGIEVDSSPDTYSAHRTDNRTDITLPESDNYQDFSENPRNLLNSKSVGRTFLTDETPESIEHSPPDEDMEMTKVEKVVRFWEIQVRNKVPPPDTDARNQGAWDIAWRAFTGEATRTEGALNFAMIKTSLDRFALEKLKALFVDYVMARVTYWQHNVPLKREQSRLDLFKERLMEYLVIPDLDSL